MRRRKFWGWGWEDAGPSPEHAHGIARVLAERFGIPPPVLRTPPRLDALALRPPRVTLPDALQPLAAVDPATRAGHTYGKSFRDVVRGAAGDFTPAPDAVLFPRDERDVAAVLDWAAGARTAVIPYGGGSSVVGGVEPAVDERYAAAVSVDLSRLDRVLEVDPTSRAARIEAGVFGPALEEQLRPHGFTLRHFPQSFEFSTLGGWIATRSGGHYATLYTHIDDFVESLRVVTPRGTLETRRLPGSGAGPSPDRLFIGSEGTLGVITEAWMRVQQRPVFRASASVTFDDFLAGARAARAIAQAGLFPANCRLLDPGEAELAGVGGGTSVLLLAFESADHPLDAWMARALECARDHGGRVPDGAGRTQRADEGARDGAAGNWRRAFLDAPYLRDTLVLLNMVSETFETAVTWDRFEALHGGVLAATEEAIRRVCGAGRVSCRFTHVYPDGPAPYYTVIAPGRPEALLEQWAEIKHAASEALLRLGGTITHHHAVGRDHRPWYDRQRPDAFAAALRAAKGALDPAGVLNPGVLIDP
ncbi:MAG TPA: FAD-binding oxidoreductase [Candidatus Limnocylindria bacterium]|nr:FAD-binding oxidoreductase [Candidatus Limnocylindria bacterium]